MKAEGCSAECPSLRADEWLAITGQFSLQATMLTAKTDTYLKKSELHSSLLSPSQLRSVSRGQTVSESRCAACPPPPPVTTGWSRWRERAVHCRAMVL